MKREIKFRGYYKPARKWLYGDLVQVKKNGDIIAARIENEDSFAFVEIDSIGQYTGLKDSNRKDIFEGDIIEVENDVTGAVIFECGQFINSKSKWGLHTYFNRPPIWNKNDTITIIGNIHQNPELIK